MGDAETQFADAVLVQHFVLEHFSAYKQYVLKRMFFSFPMCSGICHFYSTSLWFCRTDSLFTFIYPVPVIPSSAWAVSWFLIAGMMLFFFYYVLVWGLQNGDSAFKAWCLNFIVGFILEFLVIQVVRIYGKRRFLDLVSMFPCIYLNTPHSLFLHSFIHHSWHDHQSSTSWLCTRSSRNWTTSTAPFKK